MTTKIKNIKFNNIKVSGPLKRKKAKKTKSLLNKFKTLESTNGYKQYKKQPVIEKVRNDHAISILEYYDLPFRYNETIVKILYQTPNTLFVYWDINDNDRENYIKQYGENFFNVTHPVLIIHNDTMNYSFEIEINDFANSWYLHVNDSHCNYRVELGRRPNYYDTNSYKEFEEKNHSDYVFVSSSNKIELPNDHILFNTNENNTIKYRNVKTNQEKNISLYDIIKNLPRVKNSEIPYVSNEILEGLYTAIYKNDDLTFLEMLKNPTSGSTSSKTMPHS